MNTFILVDGNEDVRSMVSATKYHMSRSERIVFVHSASGKFLSDCLRKVLRLEAPGKEFDFVEVSSVDNVSIFSDCTKLFKKEKGEVHLDYTGGSSAMKVHTFMAAVAACERLTSSYVGDGKLYIDGVGGKISSVVSSPNDIEVYVEKIAGMSRQKLADGSRSAIGDRSWERDSMR